MHLSNKSANLTIKQMVLEAAMILLIWFVCFELYCARYKMDLMGFTWVLAIFETVYLLHMKTSHMFNATTFYYTDRVIKRTIASVTVTSAIMLLVAVCIGGAQHIQILLCFSGFALIAIVMEKLFYYRLVCLLQFSNAKTRVLYMGNIELIKQHMLFLSKTLMLIQPVGYIDSQLGAMFEDLPCLGRMEDMERILREHNIDVLIIAEDAANLKTKEEYADICIQMGVSVQVAFFPYKNIKAHRYMYSVGTIPTVNLHVVNCNKCLLFIKRLLDIAGAIFAIVFFSPVMIATALAIKFDSKGPVFFTQLRAGLNGRKFRIIKFRSMYVDAEQRKKELMKRNIVASGLMFKMKDDPRITKVGSFIRRFSIDELPQFFNVLKGDMSLVGTRPPTLDEVSRYDRSHWKRLSFKPGITGLWQISGRSEINDFEKVVEMDYSYIENWSLSSDLWILLKTVNVLLKQKGAY